MVDRYRTVLSAPGAPRLMAGALLGRLPQGMSGLAVLLLVRESTHSYAVAGLAVGAYTFAMAFLTPLQGRLVDVFGRLRVLAPSAAADGLVLIVLVVAAEHHAGGAVLVILSGLAGMFFPPIAPALRALLGQVFPDPAVRESAYALDAVVQEVVWTSGPLIVALVITAASPGAAVLLTAFLCVAGTVTFALSPQARRAPARMAGAPRAGVLRNHRLRVLLVPVAMMGISLGATEVGLPALALHAGSRPASGILLALWSVGSMLGGLWYGSRHWRSSLAHRYRNLLVAATVLMAPLILARTIPAGVVGSLAAGLTIAPVFSCQYALVGRVVTAGAETESFTWVSSALVGGSAVGASVGGALVGPGGVSAPFLFACLALGLAALSALRAQEPAPVGTPAPDAAR
jgi:MFS family permease